MMKNLMKSIPFILVASLFFISSAIAQSDFEGKIVYSISYQDMPAEMQGMESMLPKDMTIHIKGNKSRLEQKQVMGNNVVVSDVNEKNGFMEMDMGGQKLRINISTEEFTKEANQLSDIEYLDETKSIAGYPCKKAIMRDASGQLSMTVFYTDKISNKAQKEFVGLKGFPLQYSMNQQNMKMEMTATEVSEESVPDDIFNKSEGFKDISQSDLQNIMGGRGF